MTRTRKPSAESPDDLLTPEEVARWLRVTPAALKKQRSSDKGPPWIDAGRPRYYRWAVQDWIWSRERVPPEIQRRRDEVLLAYMPDDGEMIERVLAAHVERLKRGKSRNTVPTTPR